MTATAGRDARGGRPLALRMADWLYIGTLWGATARTIGVFFLMPVAADMARGNAYATTAVHYGRIALYCMVLLDIIGWAIRTGQIRIHTPWTPAPAKPKAATASSPTTYPREEATRAEPEEPPEVQTARTTLGVGRHATQAEIRKAYVRAAKRNHPDINQGDKTAELRFIAARKAYDQLREPA